MQVRKRNSGTEPIDAGKIVRAVRRCADGLDQVDPARVAAKTISGLYDGASTAELGRLSIQTAAELTAELKKLGRWTQRTRDSVKRAEGSVQHIEELPEETRLLFRTAWELPQRALIDMAAARAPFVDQSQALNLFMAAPSIGKLSSMYLYAWKSGLKTTYYLRSRPATRIQQATVAEPRPDADAIACSLENPETCEACH